MFPLLSVFHAAYISSFSQKAIRHLQNQHAYQVQKDIWETTLTIPSIPADLIEATEAPLPTSVLFRNAAASPNALNGTNYSDHQLGQFDGFPTYQQLSEITLTPHQLDQLMDALHGQQLCQQRKYENQWLKRYKTLPLAVLEEEVHKAMANYLDKWNAIGFVLEGPHLDDVDIALGQHAQEWLAHRCYSLYGNFQVLWKGSDAFLVLYIDHWS